MGWECACKSGLSNFTKTASGHQLSTAPHEAPKGTVGGTQAIDSGFLPAWTYVVSVQDPRRLEEGAMSDPLELHSQMVVSCHVNTQPLGHLASSPRLYCLITFGSLSLVYQVCSLSWGIGSYLTVFPLSLSTLRFPSVSASCFLCSHFLHLLFLHLPQILTS